MEMTAAEIVKYTPRRRPYPFDLERKQAVERAMYKAGIKTQTELADRLGIKQQALNAVINGTRISFPTEERIARFFGMSREELFPERSARELAQMNKRQSLTQAVGLSG